jgi:pimeloyl-ACP methyl ester carboxylesterase
MPGEGNLSVFVCVADLSHVQMPVNIPGLVDFTIIEGDYTEAQFKERPTRVIIHGFMGASDTSDFKAIENAYRELNNVNIVTVKWSQGSLDYKAALLFVPKVAAKIATFLDQHLGTNEKAWKDLKLAGHSLGAHIAGFVGKKVKNGKVGTIIGLDPAGEFSSTSSLELSSKLQAPHTCRSRL